MIFAADNINPMNPVVAQAMDALDPAPVRDLARRCAAAGAFWIDINPGTLPARRRDRMRFLVDAVQEATDVRLILDSADAEVLAEGLRACRRAPVLNALTLEPGKLARLPELAAAAGADLVALLLDGAGRVAATADEKIALAVSLWQQAIAAGLPEEHLIFDPVVPHWSWPDAAAQAAACVQVVRLLSSGAALGRPARTLAGISNLRSGRRGTVPVGNEHTLLSLLVGAGLDVALCNILDPDLSRVRDGIRTYIGP
jgi:5-methyltetrahydrofolate corrinoid/iron sulfur protein methyltransferase